MRGFVEELAVTFALDTARAGEAAVITAGLFVYGHGEHVYWGEYWFVQLPAAGDRVVVKDFDGVTHHLVVRHTEHSPIMWDEDPRPDARPNANVVTDWHEAFGPESASD